MTNDKRRLGGLLCPLLLLAACGSTGQQHATRLLDDRLQDRLAADITAGRAALQTSPEGARVTLLSTSLFPGNVDALDDRKNDARGSLVEGLLDPALVQLQVMDTSGLADKQRLTRVRNVTQYFTAYGLGGSLRPADPLASDQSPAPASPKGVVVTISVHCPEYRDGTGYGSGRVKPACD